MTSIQLLTIQVGRVQTHEPETGQPWTSGYIKQRVEGPVHVGYRNIEGDAQHNLKVHGGPHRAVLGYSADHYPRWREELNRDLPYGTFAENFTIQGQDEDSVCIGDIYAIGDVVRLQVAQPRQPCNNIVRGTGISRLNRRVDATRRGGWYYRVLNEGLVEAGMTITLLERPYPQWTVRRVYDVMESRADDPESAAELAACDALHPNWRKRLKQAAKGTTT